MKIDGITVRVADAVTERAGRMSFVLLHAIWFLVWFVSGVDHYPYQFLTLVVSLEAIFLSLFILISQRQSTARDAAEARAIQDSERASLEAILANSRALLTVIEAVRHEMAEQDEILEEIRDDVVGGVDSKRA